MNSGCAPQRVRRRHVTDENAYLVIQRWTAARSAFRTSGPSAAEPVAMPPDNGVRLDDHQRRAPVLPDSRQGDPNSRSPRSRRGRFEERFIAVSCCRSARFSKTNSRWPRSANASARATTRSSSSMHRSWLASMRKINGDEFWRGSAISPLLRSPEAQRSAESSFRSARRTGSRQTKLCSAACRSSSVPNPTAVSDRHTDLPSRLRSFFSPALHEEMSATCVGVSI